MNFFSTLIEGMTAKQKGGLVALVGGLILSGLGLAALSDAHLQIGPNGLDFNAGEALGGLSSTLSGPDSGSIEG